MSCTKEILKEAITALAVLEYNQGQNEFEYFIKAYCFLV